MLYDFTACIVTYNTEKETLLKIINNFQKIKLKFKLWISDNSELDTIKNIIFNLNDERIEYIFNNSNKGFGAGQNVIIEKLLKKSDFSEFHLMINPDVSFKESTIEGLVEYMKKDKLIGQIGPKIKNKKGNIEYSCRLLPTPINLILRRFMPVKKVVDRLDYKYEMRNFSYEKIMEVPLLSGCFIFVRTDVFRNIGKFDERYFMYLEDYDLCRRIGEKYKIIFYPFEEIVHEHGKASYKSKKMMIEHVKSAIKYFNKWGWIFDRRRKEKNKRYLNKN